MSAYNNKEKVICSKISDIPKDMHYAIIEEDTVAEHDSYGNDSFSNYRSVPVLRYYAFKSRTAWEAEITEMSIGSMYGSKKKFLPIMVNVAKMETKITVTVTE